MCVILQIAQHRYRTNAAKISVMRFNSKMSPTIIGESSCSNLSVTNKVFHLLSILCTKPHEGRAIHHDQRKFSTETRR